MDHGDLRRPRRPWGAAICETVATCVASWEVQRRDVTWRAALYIVRGAVGSQIAARWGATERMAHSLRDGAPPSAWRCPLSMPHILFSCLLAVMRSRTFAAFSAGRCSVIARMALFFIVTIARGAVTPTDHLQFSLLRMFLHPLVVAFLPTI